MTLASGGMNGLVKPLPPTNAELRQKYQPIRTWGVLSAVGLTLSVLRNILLDIPLVPLRSGLTPFVAMTALGALYAAAVLSWLAVRRP